MLLWFSSSGMIFCHAQVETLHDLNDVTLCSSVEKKRIDIAIGWELCSDIPNISPFFTGLVLLEWRPFPPVRPFISREW